jgi:NAD(P)-dependent dehydrogenase (short-subunit alcohol dehydrogenase family)
LFANAGIQAFKPILELEDADWHDQIDVNLNGTCNVIDAGSARHQIRRGLFGIKIGHHRPDEIRGP